MAKRKKSTTGATRKARSPVAAKKSKKGAAPTPVIPKPKGTADTAKRSADTKAARSPGVNRPTRLSAPTSTKVDRPPADPSVPGVNFALGSDPIELVDASVPPPKTKLTKRQLTQFRELLLAKRRELIGDVHNLTSEALGSERQHAAGDLSRMPVHMADLGSDNWEQEFTLGLIENERALVRQIDEALQRITDRTYGVCLATHRPIDPARLRAKPWARYCIEYARLQELGRVP